ncbi:amino acid permease (plasmid) [Rhizobium leguminosarum]|jgi:arginine:agmatine antiporter|uniref:Arginine/agmatine antiporter n=1 Tax=Rhizobium leguminosarum TaxID=384 RepID=A0A444ING8_RHILE|nr:amino acid permease [Rhizobium leguminosarum]ASS58564.1 amino acid permease [Rhizobium leguminosarum bv. viciae]AVC46433.1 amino acid permease family protein [Rhizobium leguminosarum bv. viciae]MBB4332282.1 arginine:agmatine antiporter [Rhizobium leguminosarum]MBB4342749.1 arginine:agmatine antiporter [Rhizobium leguminosarum]MBB4357909.1 arginine:agmatine antiporter [Rhizobium leguminosarum]
MTTPNGKSLGLAACTAIVVGNMVGSGFYLSPAAVAPYGNLAIVVWIVMGAGAICLGLTFARLASLVPAVGGPYAYTRLAYGDFAGFLIAWGYWISIWTSLPVIAIAFAGVMIDLVPAFANRLAATLLTLGVIWAIVLVNLRGVHAAALFAQVTTYAKLMPFGAVAIIGLLFIDTSHFAEFNPSGQPLLKSVAALAPLTMFAYLGLESATVPAGDVRDARRTIPRSTVLGISIAAALYVLGTIVVLGVVPREQLVHSVAPFSEAAGIMWGRGGELAISVAVLLSSIGALNGWTLLMGQVPMAAARDGLFPPLFARLSSRGVPAVGMIVSASFATMLVLVQAFGSEGFAAVYRLMVGLSTMTAVVPYAFCSLAGSLVAAGVTKERRMPRVTAIELIAFIFAIFTLYGSGAEPVLYGLVLLMLGIPVYVWQRRNTSAMQVDSEETAAGAATHPAVS